MWTAVLLLTLFAPQAARSENLRAHGQDGARELLSDPNFDPEVEGWMLEHAEYSTKPGHGASRAALLRADRGRDRWSHIGVTLGDPPTERELTFSCWLQSDACTSDLFITAGGSLEGGGDPERWSEPIVLENGDWKRIELRCVLEAGTTEFMLWVFSGSAHDVLVSDAHLVAGAKAEPKLTALRGAGVIRASAVTAVRPGVEGAGGWVSFPIPNEYRGQIPLTFDLHVEPVEALKEFRWKQREDGINVLCEVHLVPPASGAVARWESLVYVPVGEPLVLPLAKESVAPEETTPWLKSTACIQSADPAIVSKSTELASGTSDVEAFVERVIDFTSQNRGQPGAVLETLDARQALDCGGSCTSRANLAAALLRAHGIPARTVAHLPTWADKLYEHWLVEYWHPGAGWVWIEPSRGEMQPPAWSVAVLNVANPEDEDRGFDESIRHSGVMLGVPDLSVHKHSPELEENWAKDDPILTTGGNWAHAALRIQADRTQAFEEQAREAYATLLSNCLAGRLDLDRTARVEAALETKQVDALERALVR